MNTAPATITTPNSIFTAAAAARLDQTGVLADEVREVDQLVERVGLDFTGRSATDARG